MLAGLVGALATATRPNGVAIVAACAVASFIAIRDRRDWVSLAAPLLSPIGFVAFQTFLRHHTDESWPWFRVQREAWREGTSFGATAIRNTISFLGHPLASPDRRTHRVDDGRHDRRRCGARGSGRSRPRCWPTSSSSSP